MSGNKGTKLNDLRGMNKIRRKNEVSKEKKETQKWGISAKKLESRQNSKLKQKEIEEIVDKDGNIKRSQIPKDVLATTVTSKKRTDKVVQTGAGAVGSPGVHGSQVTLRYWGESQDVVKEVELGDALGYEKTMGKDMPYNDALNYFIKELGLSKEEAVERLEAIGYIPDEPNLIRLVETPNKFIHEYLESVMVKRKKELELLEKDEEIPNLIKKQVTSLKKTIKQNNIKIEKIIDLLKNE